MPRPTESPHSDMYVANCSFVSAITRRVASPTGTRVAAPAAARARLSVSSSPERLTAPSTEPQMYTTRPQVSTVRFVNRSPSAPPSIVSAPRMRT
jgi:hypothetical protein